jgi:pimeloyl-ACP methyl ester carboxylesterase
MVLLHGWMDVSASFQFLVDALSADWDAYAPDWRGYGLTQWSGADSYWFPDYMGDLDALLERIQPDAPVNLVGHSLGGNVAGLYAGVRPARVAKFVNLEGFGMPATKPEQAAKRYARWMDELRVAPKLRPYPDYAAHRRPHAAEQCAPHAASAPSFWRGTGATKRRWRRPAERPRAQARQCDALSAGRGAVHLEAGHRTGAVGRRRGVRSLQAHRPLAGRACRAADAFKDLRT